MSKFLYLQKEEQLTAVHFPERHQEFALSSKHVLTLNGIDWLLNGDVLTAGSTPIEDALITLLDSEPKTFSIRQLDYFVVGQSETADIQWEAEAHFLFQKKGGKLAGDGYGFLNGQPFSEETTLMEGDELFVAGTLIRYTDEKIMVWTNQRLKSKLIPLPFEERNDASDFHRSPRIIHREPTGKIAIAKPPSASNKNQQSLARLIIAPLTSLALMAVVYMVRPMGIYIIMMVGMSFVTITMSITSYFSQKKQEKKSASKRVEQYHSYLEKKTSDLHDAVEEQAFSLNYHYPPLATIQQMTAKKDRRLFEKTALHHDFLAYQLGLGSQETSFELDYQEEDFIQNRDELFDSVQKVKNAYEKVSHVPIVVDLMHGPVAYIGQRSLVRNQLHFMVLQLATFHSYHDVQFIASFREEELAEWEWMRWLPHSQIRSLNIRGFIYHQRSRDQVLTSLYQILKERKQVTEANQKKEETLFSPHYVFIISEMDFLMDHVIMEFIEEDLTSLGVSLIFVEEVIESLPEHVQTIVDIRNETHGNIILKESELVNQSFMPQPLITAKEKEAISRELQAVRHVLNLGNAIPETITFLEMYDVEEVGDLEIKARWNKNEAYKTLAVPLGARGKEDMVHLNLHEKAHGPHGLIAGTTGSGKSELVQSYILSLAVNFHPYEVAFLLIDYKGGGMANLFKHLPHLVGTITNLDGAQAMRALVSIKAELQKRQRFFNENEVNHINQYHKLYKAGKVTVPMPHLFIISDEFAELKAEQPDFMKELVSTARIGRSLGIHLILATQKPSGVVDDQIWSNSKFKLALKVQNASDSNEILKTPDAAQITQTGRAYLQVGNNEIYELFQSAWSGAPYVVDNPGNKEVDLTLYQINEKGQYDIISKDLSGFGQTGEPGTTITELEAVIAEIAVQFQTLGQPKVAQPWLPPLAEVIPMARFLDVRFQETWEQPATTLRVPIGIQDIPAMQTQEPLYLDLNESGHLLVASSPGYGKSTFVQTFAIGMMRQYSPSHVQFYLFDFGNNGLLPLLSFPHVADHLSIDEEEKIAKALRRIQKELKERKHALSLYKIGNVAQYNQIVAEKIPNLIIAVDGYDAVRDSPIQEEFEAVLNQVARDGVSLGMTVILTVNRIAAVRMNIQVNLKTKIGLYLFDKMDLNGLLGRSGYTAEDIPGRAMAKFDEVSSFQVFVPYDTTQAIETIQAMKEEAEAMTAFWQGPVPKAIPMMPDRVSESLLLSERSSDRFAVGLDFEDVQPVVLDFTRPLLLAPEKPQDKKGYHQLVKFNLETIADDAKIMVWDAAQQAVDYKEVAHVYVNDARDLTATKQHVLQDLKERLAHPKLTYNTWYIYIVDLIAFADATNLSEEEFRFMLTEGSAAKVIFIINSNAGDILAGYNRTAKLARLLMDQALIGVRLTDQEFEKFPFIPREPYLKTGEAYVIKNQGYQKVRLPDMG